MSRNKATKQPGSESEPVAAKSAKKSKIDKAVPDHILVQAVAHISKEMSPFKKQYWGTYAKKKGYSLDQMVLEYLLLDFELSFEQFKPYLVKKQKA